MHVDAAKLIWDAHQALQRLPTQERLQAQHRHSREGGNPAPFTPEQMHWLEMIRYHIAANPGIATDDFEYALFSREGGLGKVYQLFGDELNTLIEQLNETLAA